jgi:hypothetical protein
MSTPSGKTRDTKRGYRRIWPSTSRSTPISSSASWTIAR